MTARQLETYQQLAGLWIRLNYNCIQTSAKTYYIYVTGFKRIHFCKTGWLLNWENIYHTTSVLRPFIRDHPGKPVPEENFWTLWCKGRLTEADTPTIWLGATPSGLTSAHLHHPPHIFLQVGCPFCHPTNSVKALKATSAFGLGRRR